MLIKRNTGVEDKKGRCGSLQSRPAPQVQRELTVGTLSLGRNHTTQKPAGSTNRKQPLGAGVGPAVLTCFLPSLHGVQHRVYCASL